LKLLPSKTCGIPKIFKGDEYFLSYVVLAIRAGRIYTPNTLIRNGAVVLKNGKIDYVGDDSEKVKDATVLRFNDGICVPGFIDVHVHGGGGYDFADGSFEAFNEVCKYHVRGGTTSLLATILSSPVDYTFKILETFRKFSNVSTNGAETLGLHLEGPFLNPDMRGAHPAELLQTPSEELVGSLLEYADVIRRVTIAPEVSGGVEAVKAFSSRGVIVSIGHSNAPYDVVVKAYDAGLRHTTHLYNALGVSFKRGPYRIPGALESVLALDGVMAEMITDGRHVHPILIRLAVKTKGFRRLCLVTDAMRAAGMPDGIYKLGSNAYGSEAVVKNGISYTRDMRSFASTTISMVNAVRFMRNIGYPMREVLLMASSIPAKLLGVSNSKGFIASGFDGDLVVLDRKLRVLLTVVRGRVVYAENRDYIGLS
jgi:N-acetylglucosamine-6-phosphate deacetylase